jgi:hypothetical protein
MNTGMKILLAAILSLAPAAVMPQPSTGALAADPGWPRVYKLGGQQLTVYQPQVDYWRDYVNLHFRCAIAVKGEGLKEEKFGVAEVDAATVTDLDARTVVMTPKTRDLRFPNLSAKEADLARQIANQLLPPGTATLSLDRVLAYVDPAAQPIQRPVELNVAPPRIFYSAKPAILVMFMGKPRFEPVAPERKDPLFALNTNWDVLYDPAGGRYYLLAGEGWLQAADVLAGPWTSAVQLPPVLSTLPQDDNWAEVRQRIPRKPLAVVPTVFTSAEPAELIVTEGAPSYARVHGTALIRATNTSSVVFLHSAESNYYFLVAGRWFRAPQLGGPWTAASQNLPADFAQIPDDDPAAFVKASVPGTRAAQDAVLLASVPNTITVDTKPVTEQVVWSGEPEFAVIDGTTVQSAVNSPMSVFLVDGVYYWCHQGAWLTSASPNGPWTFATVVPAAIYTIPPSNPSYNVTYVTVQSSTPQTVTYSQTSGYSGEYVAATGVLMFGAGVLLGAALADDDNYSPYYYPPPMYSYGGAVTYNYAYGGYYSAASVYGPYGGAGAYAGYNPGTGTYSRGAYAYGPYSSAGVKQAYNPYTGAYGQGAAISTPYGSAARGAAYNPSTGAAAAGRSVQTAYGSAGGFYAEKGGQSAWGGYRSNQYGSAAGVKTSEGTGAAAWDTQAGQGAAAKTRSGDVYVGHDDIVYKKDADGGWSSNTGSGWDSVERPQGGPQPSTSTAQERPQSAQQQAQAGAQSRASTAGGGVQGLEAQSQARQYGNAQAQRSTAQRFSGQSGAGGARASGARRSRR